MQGRISSCKANMHCIAVGRHITVPQHADQIYFALCRWCCSWYSCGQVVVDVAGQMAPYTLKAVAPC